jgi:hypothetical protein
MTADTWTVLTTWIAIALGLGAGFYLIFRFRVAWPELLQESANLHSLVEKRSFEQFVESTNTLDKDASADAFLKLRDESARLYDEVIAANAALDSKATTILGFVGGGASLYALAVESKASANPHPTLLIGVGVLLFVAALLACLGCMFTRLKGGMPELRSLAAPPVLNGGTMTPARVAAFLFALNQDRHDDNLWINRQKTKYVELAHTLFAFGAIALVVNFAVQSHAGGNAEAKSSGRCVITSKGSSITFGCTSKGG